MNVAGFSAFVTTDSEQLTPCPICGTDARITGGSCLGCLLQTGLADEPETETGSLDEILSEIEIRDTDWQIGNYRILEEIGRGGMGVIYRARQRHSKRIVALKRVLSYHGDSRETLERFRREAQAAASLDHPNILPIYDVGEADGLPFFTMKYATGGTLLQMAPLLRADPRECVRLMTKITHAVAYAHRHGILHRDLKPGNILLDARTEPMVSDFGLAKWIDASSNLTRSLAIFGTPGFIAPEQATGDQEKLTPAADIYSLGAILFDFLVGRPPFLGEHALSVIRQAGEKAAPKLRTIDPSIDRDLETICAKCLEREPQARYQAAADLAEDFERWLEGRPIKARPVSPVTHTWRWAKRNKVLAATTAACILLAAVGAWWQVQSRILAKHAREREIFQHSAVVLPFLNLDEGRPDIAFSRRIAEALQSEIDPVGPASIRVAPEPPPRWTGIGLKEEVQGTTTRFSTRGAIFGTLRSVGGKTRLSLELLNRDGPEFSGFWIMDVPAGGERAAIRAMAHDFYAKFDAQEARDPAVAEPEATSKIERGYLQAGRSLLDRRTIPDMDRAIACFEGATKIAPRSVEAWSFLSLGYMGRNLLKRDQAYSDKALWAANEAVKLSPYNSAANRSLAAIHIMAGENQQAIEDGMHALQAEHPEVRAFAQIGYASKMMGRPDKAIVWFEKAKLSEQLLTQYDELIGDCWLDLGDNGRAAAAFDSAARFRPDLPEGWLGLCRLKILERDLQGARQLFESRAAEYGQFHSAKIMRAQIAFFARDFSMAGKLYEDLQAEDHEGKGSEQYGAVSYSSALARIKIERGDPAAGDLVARNLKSEEEDLAPAPKSQQALYRVAAAHAIAGEKQESLQFLRAAAEAGWVDHRSARMDPRFDAVKDSPEFDAILTTLAARLETLRRAMDARADGQAE